MKILKQESGQILIMSALGMAALLGFAGLATDVGTLFHAQRIEQKTADAAAIAGALDYKFNASASSAQAAAQAAATANGVADLSDLKVNVPPQNGPNQSCTWCVETILTEPHSTTFMSLFGFRSVNVTVRAVATASGAPSVGCMYITNPTASGAMQLQGSFIVDAPGCGIEIASNSGSALQFTGAAGTLTAGWIAVNGGAGGQTGDSNPAPITNTHVAISDPYAGNYGPPCDGGSTYSWVLDGKNGNTAETYNSSTTLTGNYAGPGDNQAVCFSNPVTLSNVVLGPGIYVFQNGVTLEGSVTGIGVTLDVQNGTLTIPKGGVSFGSATADTAAEAATDGLVAPTDGPTNGIAIMEPPSNGSEIQIQMGNATGNITGAIYAPNPNAELFLQDSGGDKSGGISIWGDIIVGQLYDKTTAMTVHSYASVAPGTAPNTAVTLIE